MHSDQPRKVTRRVFREKSSLVPQANRIDKVSGEAMQYVLGVICDHQLALAMGEIGRKLRGESVYTPT
jgi:hypothetical protein